MSDAVVTSSSRPAPLPNAYWLPGGHVAGEYPGALRDDDAVARVRALLDAGVTLFVDLTDGWELDPYAPLLEAEAAARGVTVRHLRLSIPDMGVPSDARMAEIIDALRAAESAGEVAYVHCWGGVGRTGTVAGCWLVGRGHDPDDALAEVARLFATMTPEKRRRHPEGSPQTPAQRAFVRGWSRASEPDA